MAKILIVDDELSLLSIMEEVFSDFGFESFLAKDGEEAKLILENHSDEICLVLSDIHMPRCTGIALLEHCKSLYPDLPFLIMTGFSDYKLEDLQKMGVDKVFFKPLKFAKIKQFLDSKFPSQANG